MFLWAERYYPFVFAAIAVVLLIYKLGIDNSAKAVPAATMTFGLVAAGFTATQRNLILGMRGSRVLRFLSKTGYYIDLLDYLMQCVYSALLVSIVSLVGFFIGDNVMGWKVWTVAVTSAIVLVLTMMFRNEILMSRVIKRFVEDSTEDRST